MVAIQEHQLTHVVAHGNAHSVAVGVAADDHAVAQLFGSGECELQGGRLFGVGGMNGREISVWFGLGGQAVHLGESPSVQRFGQQGNGGSVQGREDNSQLGIARAVER